MAEVRKGDGTTRGGSIVSESKAEVEQPDARSRERFRRLRFQ